MGIDLTNRLEVYSNNVHQFEKFIEEANFQEPNENLRINKILPRPEELMEMNSSEEVLSTKSARYFISKYGNYDLIHSIIHNRSVGNDTKAVLSQIPEIRNVYTYETRHSPESFWLDGIARQHPDLKFTLSFDTFLEGLGGYYRAQGDLGDYEFDNTAPTAYDYFQLRCYHESQIQPKCLLEKEDKKKEICFFNFLEVYSNNVHQFKKFIEEANFQKPNENLRINKILPRPEELIEMNSSEEIFSTKSAGYLISKYGNHDLIHSVIHNRSIGCDSKTILSETPEIRNFYFFGTKDSPSRDLIAHCASVFPDLKFTLDYFNCWNKYENIFRAHGEICSLESYEIIRRDVCCYAQAPKSPSSSESISEETCLQDDGIPS